MSESSQSLIPHYDVRATFPDMALLVGDSITFATLKKTFSTAVLAGPYDPSASYLIVERPVRNTGQNFDSPAQLLIFVCSVCFALFFLLQEFQFSTTVEESEWAFQTLAAFSEAGLQVVNSASFRYLVSAPTTFTAQHYDGFPAETEFITVLDHAIRPVPRRVSEKLSHTEVTFRADIANLIGPGGQQKSDPV